MTFYRKYHAKLNTWIRIPNSDPESVAQRIRILSGFGSTTLVTIGRSLIKTPFQYII